MVAATLVLLAGAGYVAYTRYLTPATVVADEPAEPELATAQVTRGDIVISVTGTADLVPAAELELGFRAGGTVAEVLVEVGDIAGEGDVLARLDTASLERDLAEAEVELQIAELELESVQQGATGLEVASAEASLRDAQLELTLAQDAYEATSDSRLDGVVQSAKVDYDWWVGYYQHQKAEFEEGRISQADHDWAMCAMIDAEGRWQAAINDAKNEEVQALTRLDQAQSGVAQAGRELELLHSGPESDTVVRAMLEVDQALLARENASAALAASELYAPFAGTVMDVAVSAGEDIAANADVLTLADLQTPRLQLWVEEADLASAVVGNQVYVVFEAFPDDTFAGEIIHVDPVLVTQFDTSAVQCLASLDLGDQPISLRSGMTADIEILVGEARSALLVPVEALRETSPGQYSVFVVNADGRLEQRAVAVGLSDYVNAEIVTGVEEGEIVSLGESG
jgi:RND family efflux transporter MFP subunit